MIVTAKKIVFSEIPAAASLIMGDRRAFRESTRPVTVTGNPIIGKNHANIPITPSSNPTMQDNRPRTFPAVTGSAWAGVVRPDVFRAVVLMSAPFSGPPPLRRRCR